MCVCTPIFVVVRGKRHKSPPAVRAQRRTFKNEVHESVCACARGLLWWKTCQVSVRSPLWLKKGKRRGEKCENAVQNERRTSSP